MILLCAYRDTITYFHYALRKYHKSSALSYLLHISIYIPKYIYKGGKMKSIMMILRFVTKLGSNAPCVPQSVMNLRAGTTAPVPGYQATDRFGAGRVRVSWKAQNLKQR